MIQNADETGNPAIIQDPTWTPLLTTPAFPEYAAGHPVFSAAAAQILDSFFGDNTAFSATSPSLPGVTMDFTSFDAAAQAAGESRVYGGIHFQFSVDAGLTVGQEVGDWTLQRLQPVARHRAAEDRPRSGFRLATNTDPIIAGDVTDNLSGVASLTVSLDGGAATAVAFNSDGTFSVPVNLPTNGTADGSHNLEFIATDAAGNVASPLDFGFVLDTKAPVIALAADSVQERRHARRGRAARRHRQHRKRRGADRAFLRVRRRHAGAIGVRWRHQCVRPGAGFDGARERRPHA